MWTMWPASRTDRGAEWDRGGGVVGEGGGIMGGWGEEGGGSSDYTQAIATFRPRTT